jgi:uncharacterized protein YyaL (SSP411 family)
MKSTAGKQKHANRLAGETSPYLLQHAENPVDWYPWGPEAFERARAEDKPVFLSIGYSTCHWCHVMERESFEDERIAGILNGHFVSIKVDREERPDIDAVYMNAVQVMTGTGGWPLSVFLTPEGKPFFGGTYFPPREAFGRPSFEKVLAALAEAWKKNRGGLVESAGKIHDVLAGLGANGRRQELSPGILKEANSQLRRTHDAAFGGFGNAPKFPQATTLAFLLRYWHRTRDGYALQMVETTLQSMAKGGIYDHIGGGFHRYSTDEKWLVPHFEKMLYDQALLGRVYTEAYQVTKNEEYSKVAHQIFDYVLRDMTAEDGGFYGAEDADSEGREGWFYVWTTDEITGTIGEEKAAIFKARYGVSESGNFEEGRNILHVAESVSELSKEFKLPAAEIEAILAEGRRLLLEARKGRVRPNRDDKMICAWNGVTISSLAYGGAVLDEPEYVDAARRAAEFILDGCREDGRLPRSWRGGKASGLGFLDDYALLVCGLADLYEATFEARWLAEAKRLCGRMVLLFGEADGGFYHTGSDAEKLIVREMPAYDGAIPSGNSAAAYALLRVGRLTGNTEVVERAWSVLNKFSNLVAQSATSMAAMLSAVDLALGPVQEIVIAGAGAGADTQEMVRIVRGVFLPNAVTLLHEPAKRGAAIETVAPFVASQKEMEGKATAYICEDFVCKEPINNPEALKRVLAGRGKEGR